MNRFFLADSPDRLRRILASISSLAVSKQRPLEVVVREPRREKTGGQRRLFHAVCSDIALELGNTPAQIKHAIKVDFYGEDVYIVNGVRYVDVQSSEDSDREEYSRLLDHSYLWAAEREIVIPDRRRPPNHNHRSER